MGARCGAGLLDCTLVPPVARIASDASFKSGPQPRSPKTYTGPTGQGGHRTYEIGQARNGALTIIGVARGDRAVLACQTPSMFALSRTGIARSVGERGAVTLSGMSCGEMDAGLREGCAQRDEPTGYRSEKTANSWHCREAGRRWCSPGRALLRSWCGRAWSPFSWRRERRKKRRGQGA